MTGAQFEIRIDGAPRSYLDRKDYAMEASPVFASSMIFWATASRVGLTIPSVCRRRTVSKATTRRRNLRPCRYCLIGMGAMWASIKKT